MQRPSTNNDIPNLIRNVLQWTDWLDRNTYDLARQMHWRYVPPLMIYLTAGVAGFTGIAGTFFVKEYLGVSAEFLATLSFWVMLPWALKMPLGHLVDLLWRHKAVLIYMGAALIAASWLIISNLLADPVTMRRLLPVETWFILSALMAPFGYVLQDTVADAMTVEAVARYDADGRLLPEEQVRRAHTTMQTLGRMAVVGGSLLMTVVNIVLFNGVDAMSADHKAMLYLQIYRFAFFAPLISVFGMLLSEYLRNREKRRLTAQGYESGDIERRIGNRAEDPPSVNWWILGGGLGFAAFAGIMGVAPIPYNEELVFVGSLAIVLFLIRRLTGDFDSRTRRQLYGTAAVIFVYRAVPTAGAGSSWWMIDVLGFDQRFIAQLALTAGVLSLVGIFIFMRFLAERPITYIVAFLTIAVTLFYLPNIALFYGVHQWTAAHTGGLVDARFIALADAALESPLGQIAMIPMLAWIANSAPVRLKATYFAVMAAFGNLALSLSQLLTKALNQWFVIKREVKDALTGAVTTPADYSELGGLMLAVMLIGLTVPMVAIFIVKRTLLAERNS